jgi:hypothetical protein
MDREKQFEDQLKNSVIKIVRKNGDFEGTGFFVDQHGHLLTCYHVIEKLVPQIFVEYKGEKYSAEYVPKFSSPEKDIAVLKVKIAKHASLLIGEADLDREVGAFGFRKKWFDGYRSTGTLRKGQRIPGKEVDAFNLETNMPDGESLEGMSGSPIFDPRNGWVVGLFHGEEFKGSSIVYVIPIEEVFAAWEEASRYYHASLADKLRDYVSRLQQDPEFADLDQLRYFELQLGMKRADVEMPGRLKTPLEGRTRLPAAKYSVKQAVQDFRRLVVIGEPGSGKTTALKDVALTFGGVFQRSPRWRTGAVQDLIPIYVWIPHFNLVRGDTPYDKFLALIRDSFLRLKVNFEPEEQKRVLSKFHLVLLLDGLNELGDENHREVFLNGLEEFASNHEQCYLIVSSRAYNFRFGKTSYPVLELLELAYPNGVREYLRCYLTSDDAVQGLMDILESNLQVRKLAVNPLLLRMIILVFLYEEGNVPNSRGQLFGEIARGLMGRWAVPSQANIKRSFWSEDKEVLLSELGYVMKNEGLELSTERVKAIFEASVEKQSMRLLANSSRRPSDFLPVEKQTNWVELIHELKKERILSDRGDATKVRFWHQTLQEYFAASCIWKEVEPLFVPEADASPPQPEVIKAAEKRLDYYIEDSRWHEILAIVAGLVPGKQYEDSFHKTLNTVESFIDRVWHKNRLLAAMCLSNVEKFDDERLAEYVNRIKKSIQFWAIVVPRYYPWLLLTAVLGCIWLLPIENLSLMLNLSPNSRIMPRGFVAVIGGGFAILFGVLTVSLFLRLYSFAIQELEGFTNEKYIRPSISALRYIRDDAAEGILVEMSNRIANDFAVGDTTRITIQTGLTPPIRNEPELIVLLNSPDTRRQAIEWLGEYGTLPGTTELFKVIDQQFLDNLMFSGAVRSIVGITKRENIQGESRTFIEDKLKELIKRAPTYSKRLSIYRGLLDLGVADVSKPEKGLTRSMFVDHWKSVALGFLLLLSLLLSRLYSH